MRLDFQGTSKQEILDLDDELLNKALFTPDAPHLALRVFSFLAENQHLVIRTGGMKNSILGLDKVQLDTIAKRFYNIDLSKWTYPLSLFEKEILKLQDN